MKEHPPREGCQTQHPSDSLLVQSLSVSADIRPEHSSLWSYTTLLSRPSTEVYGTPLFSHYHKTLYPAKTLYTNTLQMTTPFQNHGKEKVGIEFARRTLDYAH